MAEEITFRVASGGVLNAFTAERPHLTLALWCDWTCEVLEVGGARGEDLDALAALLRRHSTRVEAHALGASHLFVINCVSLPHDDVNQAVDAAGALQMPPVRFEGGREEHRVIAFDAPRAREALQALRGAGRGVEVVAKRALKVQPLLNTLGAGGGALLEALTDKQVEALLAAQRHGLYASPRRTEAAQVAKALGVSRSTFEEHLRRGEANLLAALVPYLELHHKMRQGATVQEGPPPGQAPGPAAGAGSA